jgi:uncharacterized protein (DUF2147 family)
MRRIVVSLLALLALAVVASAADATGKWTGTLTPEGGQGNPAILILKQAGPAITGSAGPNEEQQWPIQTGKIEASKISLQVTDPENGRVYKLELTLDGDHMKGDVTASDGEDTRKAKVELDRAK